MNWWKIGTVVFGLSSALLGYRAFDQGITRTYLEASDEAFAKHIQILTKLVEHEWLGLPEGEVVSRLKSYVASQPSESIVIKRETETHDIYLEGIRFEFQNGKLLKVGSRDRQQDRSQNSKGSGAN